MSNFPLVTIEGSGNFNPAGTVVTLAGTLPRVFEVDGILYSKDNTPGRVIPDFLNKVPEQLRGRASDLTVFNFMPSGNSRDSGASISSTGTIVKVSVVSGVITVDRKLPTDTQFVTMFTGGYSAGNSTNFAGNRAIFVVTDHLDKWCVAVGKQTLVSLDNGSTWNSKLRSDAGPQDLRVGPSSVLLMSVSNGSSYTLLRSTDFGLTWVSVSVAGTVVSLTPTTGNNWVALTGTTATFTSADNGVTWVTGGTLGHNANAASTIMFTNGRFYVKTGTNVYTGTVITTLTLLTSVNTSSIGVDASGNCISITQEGVVSRSVAGANFTTLDYKASSDISNVNGYNISFSNGVWCDKDGGVITNTNLVNNNRSWTSFALITGGYFSSFGTSRVGHSDTPTGVSIYVLNYNSYLRSTDNWITWELRNFNVANRTQLATGTEVRGVASDGFGNWAIVFNASSQLLYSTDGGLTWVFKVSPATQPYDIVGGGGAGCFYIKDSGGVGRHTSNGFSNSTNKNFTASNMGSRNAVYIPTGFFVDVWHEAANNVLWFGVTNATTGVFSQYTINHAVKTGASFDSFGLLLNTLGSSVIFGFNQVLADGLNVSASPVFFVDPAVWNNTTNGTVRDGIIVAASWDLQINGTTVMPRSNSPLVRTANFESLGIRPLSLTSNQYLKVT